MNLKKLERYLRVNLLGPGPHLTKKKRIYQAAIKQRLRNNGLGTTQTALSQLVLLTMTQQFSHRHVYCLMNTGKCLLLSELRHNDQRPSPLSIGHFR